MENFRVLPKGVRMKKMLFLVWRCEDILAGGHHDVGRFETTALVRYLLSADFLVTPAATVSLFVGS